MAYFFENQYLRDQNLIDLSSHFYSNDFLYKYKYFDEKMINNNLSNRKLFLLSTLINTKSII